MALYLEDIEVGSEFVSDEVTITAEDIIAFATQFDPQPFHLDPEAAKGGFFADSRRVAGTRPRSQCAFW
ncbi:MAG TPA: MaoC/PaaZ C-terminal domain-containing protein [Galbitalea sp.]|nr:MaoC/PaaZ C-terminal domain-containing protein [Galbitalea sp.]